MNIIKKYENVALSNIDILKLLDHKANIILYPDLHKYKNIDEILEPYGACVLLFEAVPQYGHWVCLFKVNNDTLEFFNPYGGYPDDSLLSINKYFRKISKQDKPKLSLLMLNSPYKLTYNEFPFQKKHKNVKTCGRHCVFRLLNRFLNLYQYLDFLNFLSKKWNLDYDAIVTILTSE
jgi:hypothetical protein